MSYRTITPASFAVEGGRCELHKRGSAKLTSNAERGYDGAVWLSPYDLAQLLRMCSGSDAEALRILSVVMADGHRFTDYQCPIAPDNATLELAPF